MADRSFTAVRAGRGSTVATGVEHDDGTVTVDAYYDHVTVGSMDAALEVLGTLSTEPVDIVWD